MCSRRLRLQAESQFEELNCGDSILLREPTHRLNPAQKCVIRIQSVLLLSGPNNFGGSHLADQCPGDSLRNLVLNGEKVFDVPVIPFGPNMIAGRCLNELCGDPDAPARFAHTSFDDIAYSELPSDLGDVNGTALEDE